MNGDPGDERWVHELGADALIPDLPAVGAAEIDVEETVEPGRVRALLLSRLVEQGIIGLGSLLLARILGVDDFGLVAIVFVVYSITVTVADAGLGIGILRQPTGRPVATASRTRMRAINLAVALGALGVGTSMGDSTGAVVAGCGVVWVLGAEAIVAKSLALRFGRARRAAVVEAGASVLLGAVIVVAALNPANAVTILLVGLVIKEVAEILGLPTPPGAFAVDGDRPRLAHTWGAVVLAFLIANLDYLIVGAVLAPAVLSAYFVGFRIANAITAQIGVVAVRVSVVDLAVNDPTRRQAAYDRFLKRLVVVGIVGAVATIAVAPLLPAVLGAEWVASVGVTMTLSLAVPWRLALSIAGSLALAGGAARTLFRLEFARLLVVAIALLVTANIGFAPMVATVAALDVVATVTHHLIISRATGVRPPRALVPAAVLSLAGIAAMATTVSVPGG